MENRTGAEAAVLTELTARRERLMQTVWRLFAEGRLPYELDVLLVNEWTDDMPDIEAEDARLNAVLTATAERGRRIMAEDDPAYPLSKGGSCRRRV